MVSNLVITEAAVKLLIAKGVSTDEEFIATWRRSGEISHRVETASLKWHLARRV
jgi:putative SOS response-associated peptidase YedK